MANFTLTIGLNDKDTLRQEIETSKAIDLITNTIEHDMTIKQGNIGVYTMASGQRVVENSLDVLLYGIEKTLANKYAKKLCKVLNQESIILVENTIQPEFIS